MKYELSNYEALHGWGVVKDATKVGRPLTLQSVEFKLYAAYETRGHVVTTIGLTDPERDALAEAISDDLEAAARRGERTKAVPHLQSLLRRIAPGRYVPEVIDTRPKRAPKPGQYNEDATVEVGVSYRHPMRLGDDLIVKVLAVRAADGGEMADVVILSGGTKGASKKMSTRSWALIPLEEG